MASKKKDVMEKGMHNTIDQVIYCGPALPNGLLARFSVFRNGLPKHLDEHIEKCPALAKCFVPVQSLSATLKAQSAKGSAEHALFQEVSAHFRGGVQ